MRMNDDIKLVDLRCLKRFNNHSMSWESIFPSSRMKEWIYSIFLDSDLCGAFSPMIGKLSSSLI